MLALPPSVSRLGENVSFGSLVIIIILGATLPHGVHPFPLSNAAASSLSFANSPSVSKPPAQTRSTAAPRLTWTSLSNMLRDFASYDGDSYYYPGGDYRSTDWRRNQGYNLNRPTPPELGGTPEYYGYDQQRRDLETNPYYDPGWAQSVRRDSKTDAAYNYYNSFTSIETYPGFTNPRNTDKVYTNPTNPYYNPIWSQSVGLRSDEPIREGDHTSYYAPGYDIQNRNYYMNMNYNGYYNEYDGYGGGYGGGRMMRGGGGMYMSSNNEVVTDGGGLLLSRVLAPRKMVNNDNSLMR